MPTDKGCTCRPHQASECCSQLDQAGYPTHAMPFMQDNPQYADSHEPPLRRSPASLLGALVALRVQDCKQSANGNEEAACLRYLLATARIHKLKAENQLRPAVRSAASGHNLRLCPEERLHHTRNTTPGASPRASGTFFSPASVPFLLMSSPTHSHVS